MRRLEIINGPNNNFYGIRNKDVYGSQTYDGLIAELMEYGAGLGFEVHAYQNNGEGALIDHLQELYLEADRTGVKIPVVLNPGAYTHYSYALMDALESVHALVPAIEVHMSNIQDRDSFRHISVTAPECLGQIAGFGKASYKLAARVQAARRDGGAISEETPAARFSNNSQPHGVNDAMRLRLWLLDTQSCQNRIALRYEISARFFQLTKVGNCRSALSIVKI